MVFKRIRDIFSESSGEGFSEDYLEIDLEQEKREKKVNVNLFVINEYEDVNDVLNALREGYTIAVINVKPLRQKDSIELKRAVSKIKKTTDALQGDIKGFGRDQPDIIIATPSFAQVGKGNTQKKKQKETEDTLDLS